jgi:hypothetical protein
MITVDHNITTFSPDKSLLSIKKRKVKNQSPIYQMLQNANINPMSFGDKSIDDEI